jgi:hypothetical protein
MYPYAYIHYVRSEGLPHDVVDWMESTLLLGLDPGVLEVMIEAFLAMRPKFFAIQDEGAAGEANLARVRRFLDTCFPEPSSFERALT